MKTTLFLFLSLLLWCSFSSFKNDSTRPNGCLLYTSDAADE